MNQIANIAEEIYRLAPKFEKQNAFGLKFESECLFAKQLITKNDFVFSTAQNNPNSLQSAILNVAAVGISLNPATALAYLVPRGGSICLDISYRGLVKLATDAGAIEWAKAVLVYEGDTFKWRGPAEPPLHEADVFDTARMDAKDPLKNLKGGYCLAKLTTGEYMVDVMTAGEILEVKNSSKAKDGPWNHWAGEMAKKTLVKRASKSWPQGSGRERFDRAVEVLNEHEGLLLEQKTDSSDYLQHSPEQKQQFDEMLKASPIEFYCWWIRQDERVRASLYNSFERGSIGKMKSLIQKLETEGRNNFEEVVMDVLGGIEGGHDGQVIETIEPLSAAVLDEVKDQLIPAHITELNRIRKYMESAA